MMAIDVIQHDEIRSQRAPDDPGTAEAPRARRRAKWGAWLTHWGVLLAMTDPEAAIALSYGVPNLDDDTLVRLLNEHRVGI